MPEPSLDHWTVIFLIAAFQGIFLSIVLFFQPKGRMLANRLLALMVLLFSLTMIEYVAYWSRYLWYLPHLLNISNSFVFLYGVLLLFYVKLLNKNELIKKDLLHLLPFALFFLFSLPMYLQSTSRKMEMIAFIFRYQNPDRSPNYDWLSVYSMEFIMMILKNLNLTLYVYLIYNEIFVNRPNRAKADEKISWQKSLFFAYLGFALSYVSFYFLAFVVGMNIVYDYSISFAMSFFIYLIGYAGYLKPEVLSGESNKKQTVKYERSALKEEQKPELLEKLNYLMKKERVFLENNLKMNDLAGKMGISSHQLSQLINQHLKQNFTDFINAYRINEAKKLLSDEKSDKKIIAIALESGFNNKTSFLSAFRKFTGMLPTEYKNRNKVTH